MPCHHYDLLALVASSCCPCNVSFPGSTSHHLVLEVSSSLKHDLVDLAGCERFSHYYIEASCVSSPSFISVEDKSEIPQRHFECWAIFVQCQKGYSDCLNLNAIQFLLWHLKTSLSLDWVSPNEIPHGNAWSHQILSKVYITPKFSVHRLLPLGQVWTLVWFLALANFCHYLATVRRVQEQRYRVELIPRHLNDSIL